MSLAKRIVIACGGTGGHLFPGIAVAEALLEQGHVPLLLISQKKIDSKASEKYPHLSFQSVPALAKPATFSPKMIPFLLALWKSVQLSKKIIGEFRAHGVIGMGGFTSLPPVYAGYKMKLKTFVHDSNARPGRANVLTSRFCDKVLIGLAPASVFFHKPTQITGTPARPEIHKLPTREEAAKQFGLNPSKPVLLVTGGSQGASGLNQLVAEMVDSLPEEIQILHIAGPNDYPRLDRQFPKRRAGYHLIGFCDQMPSAYAIADFVITRSGASTLTELSIVGLPSLLVPYPYAADDHQTANAKVFLEAGAALLYQQKDLSKDLLAKVIQERFADTEARNQMVEAVRKLSKPEAANEIVRAIIEQI